MLNWVFIISISINSTEWGTTLIETTEWGSSLLYNMH